MRPYLGRAIARGMFTMTEQQLKYYRDYYHRVAKYKPRPIATPESRRHQSEKNKAAYLRRKDDPDFKARRARNWRKAYQRQDVKERVTARLKAKRAVRKGILQKENCARCGSAESQIHHPDYSKPLEIIWLCLACHVKEHHPV